jgi:hypothetical protein
MQETTVTKTKPEKTITIMADFGNGPYAWLKEAADESSLVGENIADSVSGFCGEPPVSAALEQAFAEWVTGFEQHCDEPTFDWQGFHSRGLDLSHRLYRELAGSYRVFYDKPYEDPSHPRDARTEIQNDRNA